MLGECQSKCEHIKDAPILPDTKRQLFRLYLAKGVLATTAIEGNTLTEEEVIEHLEGKLRLPPSREYQAREIDNIVRACNEVLDVIKRGLTPHLDVERIKTLNREVLQDLTVADHVTPGELRKVSVGVSRYRAAPAADCEYLLERLCDWLNGPGFDSPPDMKIVYAIIKAALAHLYIAWIHPFGDGNGRTARLIEFSTLISSGVSATAAHLLSNHYNHTRPQYYVELERASQSKGDIIPFLVYAVRGLLDGLREQVATIQKQQWKVVWRDFVHTSIKGKSSPFKERKQKLVFAISNEKEPMPVRQIAELPQLVREYRNPGSSTLKHDIDELVKEGLLVRDKGKIRARIEAISGLKNIVAV
ncbi:MAG: Fic family protein [Deltaproteobacteria bacterium]|nr:Fic family protein [Deltaproteobacteria bacterium]